MSDGGPSSSDEKDEEEENDSRRGFGLLILGLALWCLLGPGERGDPLVGVYPLGQPLRSVLEWLLDERLRAALEKYVLSPPEVAYGVLKRSILPNNSSGPFGDVKDRGVFGYDGSYLGDADLIGSALDGSSLMPSDRRGLGLREFGAGPGGGGGY